MISRSSLSLLGLLGLTLFASPVAADVNGTGQSDRSSFSSVLVVPEVDPSIGDIQSLGGDDRTHQLNLSCDGTVGTFFDADAGAEINVMGGTIGIFADAQSGSEFNISAGSLGDGFRAFPDSVVNISGGTIGDDFHAFFGSTINLRGSDFFLDGVSLDGSLAINNRFTIEDRDVVLSGLLADGTPFSFDLISVFDPVSDDDFFHTSATLTVTLVRLPPSDPASSLGPSPSSAFDTVVNNLTDERISAGRGVGGIPGETVQLNVSGSSSIGMNFDALSGSEVNIGGGLVDNSFTVHAGSEANIFGGRVNNGLTALPGSRVNISGRTVLAALQARTGSVVNISGGAVGGFSANCGSEVNITGGAVGGFINARMGSDVELVGGEFRLNGAEFTGDTITLLEGDGGIFTGTLSDGSTFIFSDFGLVDAELNQVNLTIADLPPLDTNPMVVDTPVVSGASGLRAGQELTVVEGGVLSDNFALVDATFNVEAGTVGDRLEAYNSVVNVSGGTVGSNLNAYLGSVVNISGGRVQSGLQAHSGSVVNISGEASVTAFRFDALAGSVVNISGGNVAGSGFDAFSGSVVNISGGSVGSNFEAQNGSEVNISGGTVDLDDFIGGVGSSVNFQGREFSINGTLLSNLQLDQPSTITDREVTFSGVLADGEPFSFFLDTFAYPNFGSFSANATLTVTLVEPVVLLGDANQDREVNFLDISPFISVLSSGEFQAEADCNEDGEVSFLDIAPFIVILAGG